MRKFILLLLPALLFAGMSLAQDGNEEVPFNNDPGDALFTTFDKCFLFIVITGFIIALFASPGVLKKRKKMAY